MRVRVLGKGSRDSVPFEGAMGLTVCRQWQLMDALPQVTSRFEEGYCTVEDGGAIDACLAAASALSFPTTPA